MTNIQLAEKLFAPRSSDPVERPSTWTGVAKEANYQPREVARLCCVSFRTVQRHFRKHYESTFTDWLREHRMDEARRRILEGGHSLKEICFQLGYKQPSHFTRVFKKHFGVPPSLLAGRYDGLGAQPMSRAGGEELRLM